MLRSDSHNYMYNHVIIVFTLIHPQMLQLAEKMELLNVAFRTRKMTTVWCIIMLIKLINVPVHLTAVKQLSAAVQMHTK